jgi:hypothetical protein
MMARAKIGVLMTLACEYGNASLIFMKTCVPITKRLPTGTPFPGIKVTVQCGGQTVATGTSDGTGLFTFPKKCLTGQYTVTYTADSPYKGGTFKMQITSACADDDPLTVNVGLKDGLTCCPCGPVPTQLYLTDSLGTAAFTFGGGGGSGATSGRRDHVDDQFVNQYNGLVTYDGDDDLTRLLCLRNINDSHDPCIQAVRFASTLQKTTHQVGTGTVTVQYGLGCDTEATYDQATGKWTYRPFFQLTASWAFGAGTSFDYIKPTGRCCWDANGLLLSGDAVMCGQGITGAYILHCMGTFATGSGAIGCTECRTVDPSPLPDTGCTVWNFYGDDNFGSVTASKKIYMDECDGSALNLDFGLDVGDGNWLCWNGGGHSTATATAFSYPAPPQISGPGFCYSGYPCSGPTQADVIVPEPPGGSSVLVSS